MGDILHEERRARLMEGAEKNHVPEHGKERDEAGIGAVGEELLNGLEPGRGQGSVGSWPSTHWALYLRMSSVVVTGR